MLAKMKTKHLSNICKILVLSSSITPFMYSNNICWSNTKEILSETETNSNLFFEYKNGDKLSILVQGNKITIKRSNATIDRWVKELELNDTLYFNDIVMVDELGFVIVNNYCDNKSHSEALSNVEDRIHKCDESAIYNLIAFNSNGDLLINEDTSNISDEYFNTFLEDVFMIGLNSFESELNYLSQEELYNKALELLSVAEESLDVKDIEKAKLAISKINDETNKDSLLKRLNVISNTSIDAEISNSTTVENTSLNDIEALSTSSEIILSVDTNNITFDFLNVSEDTILNKAITLDVTSTLDYDINMYIEGGIVSNTNSTNLNNNIFSVKESNSVDFLTFDDTGVVTILSNNPSGVANSHSIDVRLNTSTNIIRDVYKTVFKIEAVTR